MYNNQGYGYNQGYNTGYPPNPYAPLNDAITRITENYLREQIGRGLLHRDIANEVFNRLQAQLSSIVNDFMNSGAVDQNGYINSDYIYRRLTTQDIPNTIQNIQNAIIQREMYNSYNYQNNAGYQQPAPIFGNRGNMPQYNNMGIGRQPFGQLNMPPANPMNPDYATMGMGRKMLEKANKNIQQNMANMQATMPPQQPMQPQPQSQPQYTNTLQETLNYKVPTYIVSVDGKRTLIDGTINKLTSNSNEVLNNEPLINSKLQNPSIPEVSIVTNENSSFDVQLVTSDIVSNPETPVHIEAKDYRALNNNGDSVTTTNLELSVPVRDAREAIELVKEALPGLTSQNKWVAKLSYNELIVKKLPGMGEKARQAFKDIRKVLHQVTTFKEISSKILPIINRQEKEVKEYITSILFGRINVLLKIVLSHPKNPTVYPIIEEWKEIFEFADRNNTKFDYITYMFNTFGEEYPKALFLCVKSAFIDVVGIDSDQVTSIEKVIDTTQPNILAKCNDITAIVNKFRISDYGVMPENFRKELFTKIDKDYLVHVYPQDVFVTNLDILNTVATPSKYTKIVGIDNLESYSIITILKQTLDENSYKECTIIQMDQTGTQFIGIYTINVCINKDLTIIRQ